MLLFLLHCTLELLVYLHFTPRLFQDSVHLFVAEIEQVVPIGLSDLPCSQLHSSPWGHHSGRRNCPRRP